MRQLMKRRAILLLLFGLFIGLGAASAAGITSLGYDAGEVERMANKDSRSLRDTNHAMRSQVRREASKIFRAEQRAQGGEEDSRSFEQPQGDVRWTLTRTGGVEGTCLDVAAEQIRAPDRGDVGSCGASPANGIFTFAIGGVQIGDQWFNVVYGEVLREASGLRVTLADGSVQTDRDFSRSGGMWILVIPADPVDPAADIAAIEALDGSGLVIAREEPPSMVAYRRAASAAQRGTDESLDR